MKKYNYIIVGGGMAGSAAAMGIRKNDPSGSIAIFSNETYAPYNRPPLSKGLWEKMKVEDIFRPINKYDADLNLEVSVLCIDREKKVIETIDGKNGYTKLLLATGGTPIRLPDIPEDVLNYRTLSDFEQLQAFSKVKNEICIIGGGFIGSELAAALNKIGKSVTLTFPELGISDRVFPNDLSLFLNEYYSEHGVNVLPGQLVIDISKQGQLFRVTTKDVNTNMQATLEFEAVVLGVGLKPNMSLAEAAGLAVDDGIVVNEFLQTIDPDIYAAGDVANFYNTGLLKRTRVEHEDNANNMGMIAGLNMSGSQKPYTHFPFFYSDLFDLGYEAVGEFNHKLQIIEDWIEPFKKGVLYYLDGKKVKGIVFWDLWGKIDEGREIIKSGKEYSVKELKGLFKG